MTTTTEEMQNWVSVLKAERWTPEHKATVPERKQEINNSRGACYESATNEEV